MNKLGVDGAMMRNTLKSVTGERTVPAIFICGEPVRFHLLNSSIFSTANHHYDLNHQVKGGSNGLTELASSGRYTKANTNTNTFCK